MSVYFDNSATTKPFKEVIKKISEVMENNYGNPSSAHKFGLMAYKELQKSREILAALINSSPDEIIFTSGGSESNNMVLKGIARPGLNIITTSIEHASIMSTCRELENSGVEIKYLPVDSLGRVDLKELENSVNKDTALVSIMHVNNEIGTIQDIKAVSEIVRSKSTRAKFHVDAVQSFGKLPIDVKEFDIDFLSASAHKIHGPKGIGLCYIRKNIRLRSLITGGEQELGIRAGTVNVPGAAGFAAAGEIINKSMASNYQKVWELKEYFIQRLKEIPEAIVTSYLTQDFTPYILNVQFKGIRGEILLRMLEEKDIFVSSGAACSSKSNKDSHVLKAVNIDHEGILSSVRFSFNPYNDKEEIDKVVDELKKSLIFLRRMKK
ncbi:cysteine desulfurase family protein [Clostridium polynesiense]|uniref:cysteine desulfurase family protein n=1 Tax=Clostridium polynesiense TaxID=1325933 RepID=UPI00058BD2B7|nr:cysteine desulfurase family protein [Clostridium polynesiense]